MNHCSLRRTTRVVVAFCAALGLLTPLDLNAQDDLSCFLDATEAEMELLAISCGALIGAPFLGRVLGRDVEGRRVRPRGIKAFSFGHDGSGPPTTIGLNTIHGKFSITVPWMAFSEHPVCRDGEPAREANYGPVRYRFSAENCDDRDVWFDGDPEEHMVVMRCWSRDREPL